MQLNSCAIIPQVRNESGELVDSKLFADLLTITSNRDEAKRYYILSKDINPSEDITAQEVVNTFRTKKGYYNRVEFANLYNGKNAKQVLEGVLKNTTSPLLKTVGESMLANVDKIDFVKFRLTISLDDNNPARYDANTGLIQLNSNKSDKYYKESWNEYIIHELVHAYTVSGLSEPTTEAEKTFNVETRDIYLALERSKIRDAYGFTNRYEFIAEFLSNPAFRDELQFKQPTMLKKLINAFKKLLGIQVKSDIDLLTDQMLNFINVSSPSVVEGGFRILNKKKEGVVSEINTYASERIDANGNIKSKERFLLQLHKKVKFKIGKLNKKVENLTKEFKAKELLYKADVRKIIADYTEYNNGVYDTGYQNAPAYRDRTKLFDDEKAISDSAINDLIIHKNELSALVTDLDTTTDINANEADYINLALREFDEIEARVDTYDLSTKEGQTQLAEDYLFTRLVNKTPEITKLQETASNLSNKLLQNISTYISTISDSYLNTDGLGDNVKIDVESILETNDDIIQLGKAFEGFGDYPRLEAQLIHNITMTGKEKARLDSLKVGQKILDHMRELQSWAKKNKKTNLIGQGSIRKAYAQLVATNHLDRLDLVKPFTNRYYEDINKQFKIAYDKNSGPAQVTAAKLWLKDNYYTKPTTGIYINPRYTYIQSQPELKGFYDFFKETIKNNYGRLPEYINFNNEEKIPTLIRNSFWEFFSMRKGNIMRSTLLALKTVLIGQGRAEFYDVDGNPKEKFELTELSQDDMKLRMIGEVRADIKSFDLGNILFEFTSFVNDYSEMEEVLPKVRMIQNIVETKEYVSTKNNGLFGLKKQTIAGGQSRMYDAINLYITNRVVGKEDSPKMKIPFMGGDIVDNNGDVVGSRSYYVSDIIRGLIKYTRVLQLGFNPFSGINNILAGLMGDMIEASGGKFFSKKQLLQAITIYTSNSLSKDRNIFNGDKNTTKLNLLSEYLQPLEEIGEWQDKRDISMGSPTLIGKLADKVTSNAFIFQEAGEDFVQKITMIAYLLNKKTPAGSSYWSMVDVKDGELEYKQEANFDTKEELLKSRNTILDINHAIHGNYSKDNSSVYDGTLLFDSALVFKKWVPYMIRNRFMSKRYNYRTGKNDEGFYVSGARGISKSLGNMSNYFKNRVNSGQALLRSNKPLTAEDIIGIKKIVAEMAMFLTFAVLSKILLPPPDEDKDKFYVPNWWEHLDISMWDSKTEFDNTEGVTAIFLKSMVDSANRLSSEAIQMYDPSFYKEAAAKWALWSTLTEGWDAIRETFRFLGAEDRLDNRDLRFKGGVNKGKLRVEKEVTDLIPYYKQIERAKSNGKRTIEELNK